MPTDTEQERAEFEAWATAHYYLGELSFDYSLEYEYSDLDIQGAWEAYQAGRAAPLAERDALREALTEICDEIDKHEVHAAISKTSILWFKRKARAALAQGEV